MTRMSPYPIPYLVLGSLWLQSLDPAWLYGLARLIILSAAQRQLESAR